MSCSTSGDSIISTAAVGAMLEVALSMLADMIVGKEEKRLNPNAQDAMSCKPMTLGIHRILFERYAIIEEKRRQV
jgi:hypothetical protein